MRHPPPRPDPTPAEAGASIHQHPRDAPTGSGPSWDLRAPADVQALLQVFYHLALVDALLAPVFQTAGMRLETHLPRLAAFWEVTLLGTGGYTGSPLALHRQAAAASGLGEVHFTRWLVLWERAVRSLFAGPIATRAVTEAERMAVGMLRDLRRHPAQREGNVGPAGQLHLAATVRTAVL